MARAEEKQQLESESQMAQRRAQRASWALLQRVHTTLDLSCADVIEVMAKDAGAHVALLARQFPGVHFELNHEATRCADSIRILWAPDGLTNPIAPSRLQAYDAVIITHPPEAVSETLAAFKGFARVAAVREFAKGRALAIFGKGLARDLFKARVRDIAA
ncbi:hypothetical protein PbB2_01071 [Candidatus Phycosocius bacilliformis]|uniref:Uncharacterized protein n=2 Tax=Candidatus Phycosocius bacilliformis TaxID=1445552 RepID=A0A2P2E8P6_9PROT|nr:hypothetical protein PbB2_01071 [Candidatus Phycosocius bacilliformis]